ncbi:MAG: polyhydroxyalkanoate synthesis regulator DNA-binding domain-containing protein [candidate division WOR-3 bacterium]|nr:polyhydroxyalkanoate synthesis regulator DNA-binding domain-containing protein [candidate division WOR-3 bacterium]MDW7987776.1 polyhydroxyalkanoate synthesis regulator DNA-binding domain-containing protein [candidate division WOR-3 bacterium]
MRRVIKRYKNRKLYDLYTGTFVTLLDLQAMIKAGDELIIIDHETKKDITDFVLIQVIIETIKNIKPQISLSGLLHNLIKANWKNLHKVLKLLLTPVPVVKISPQKVSRNPFFAERLDVKSVTHLIKSQLIKKQAEEITKLKEKITQLQKEIKKFSRK